MKVLFLQKKAHKSGASVCLERTIRTLRNAGLDAMAIVGEHGWLSDRLIQINALCGIVPFPSFRSPLSKWFKLRLFSVRSNRIWDEYGPFHIIHANDIWDALLTEWLALKHKVKWIVHLRSDIANRPLHYYKYHCHKAHATIAVSDLMYNAVKTLQHNIVEYIPEGISKDEFIAPGNRTILFPNKIGVIGNGSKGKGWDDLAEAFIKVERAGGVLPEVIYFFGGIDKKRAGEITKMFPHKIRVLFQGHVSNLSERLSGMDIIIAPSRHETFGMAMVETIAAGTPVIASNTGITPQIMGSDSPWMFSPSNPDSIAETWLRLPEIWPEHQQFISACQQKLKDGFLIDHLNERLLALYRHFI